MVACRVILSAPVPFPFLLTLDLGFGTWIWDLDLGLGFGTGLGLDNLFSRYLYCQILSSGRGGVVGGLNLKYTYV